jgi:hypothetical protein
MGSTFGLGSVRGFWDRPIRKRKTRIVQLMPIIQTHHKTSTSRNDEKLEQGTELNFSTVSGLILIPTGNKTSEFSRVGKFVMSDYEEGHVLWRSCKYFDTLTEAKELDPQVDGNGVIKYTISVI